MHLVFCGILFVSLTVYKTAPPREDPPPRIDRFPISATRCLDILKVYFSHRLVVTISEDLSVRVDTLIVYVVYGLIRQTTCEASQKEE